MKRAFASSTVVRTRRTGSGSTPANTWLPDTVADSLNAPKGHILLRLALQSVATTSKYNSGFIRTIPSPNTQKAHFDEADLFVV